ncbi:hypothetical protein LTR49_028810, partial [Elasticomyces elasticus]
FCLYVPEAEMETLWEGFERTGPDWHPQGKQRLIILERNDVAFLPANLVHAIYTVQTAVTIGGAVWDEHDIIASVRSLQWAQEHPQCANWSIPDQLPLVIEGLHELVHDNVYRFARHHSESDFLRAFHNVIRDFMPGNHPSAISGIGRCKLLRARRHESPTDSDDDEPHTPEKRICETRSIEREDDRSRRSSAC